MTTLRRFLPYIALAALVVAFLRQAAFTNLIFARGDTLLYFYPYWDYRADALLGGRLPLWNPYLFMGAPFLANSQAGVFYPLNWPLAVFSAPAAVKISTVAHLVIAAWGACSLARRAFGLGALESTFAAGLYALGGYVAAQVEHVNQLQGLAWMPLALLATHRLCNAGERAVSARQVLRHCGLLAILVALVLTAGHTQTAFITLVACGVVMLHCLAPGGQGPSRLRLICAGSWLGATALGFALAAVQLLPAYELSQLSLRGGGLPLNEAVSFSLNPLLLGRALLPGYSRLIFSEYVAHVGLASLVLGVVGLAGIRRGRAVQLAALLAGLGLFLAIGGYNPLYLLMARFLPGFNLFRVPARWLALWALGGAMLAGLGLQMLARQPAMVGSRARALAIIIPLALASLALLSAGVTPQGERGPIGPPAPLDLALWLAALALTFAAVSIGRGASRFALPALAAIELLIASQALPLNHLTTPDAYASIRPAMTELLVAGASARPPARFLSLSSLEFDPGDLGELRSALSPQLPPDAVYDAVVATKHKEVLSPNLPLTWKIPAVDGYDGGILPLRQYAAFAAQFGPGAQSPDGRLRQTLTAIPPNWLLNVTNTRWVITDKLGDAWIDDVFYDLGLPATVSPDRPLDLRDLPQFQATAIGLVLGPGSPAGTASIALGDGSTLELPITSEVPRPAIRLRLGRPATVVGLTLTTDTSLVVRGASLIDERTGVFQSLTLGPYRLVHSGDMKIYENLQVLPRAFVVSEMCAGLACRPPTALAGSAAIVEYEAEWVAIQATTDAPAVLILSDAEYPGWTAAVDGEPVPITRAYGLFRAVPIPAGSHRVEFRYDPGSVKLGAVLSLASLIVIPALFVLARRREA